MKKITKLLSVVLCLAMLMGLAVAVNAATPAEIVDAAYALEPGASMDEAVTLTGEITEIDTPYNSQFSNISVVIAVEGKEDKPILCYRLKGDGADTLAVGDTITVTGTILKFTNTDGTYVVVEFGAGCTLDNVVKGSGETPTQPEDPSEVVEAAYALEIGASLPYVATLTGEITTIDTAYSADYQNITVTIKVDGADAEKPIQCFRMKGEGADTLAVGDKITVTGEIKNYNGKVQFNAGCTFVPAEAQGPVIPSNAGEIVDAAYALADGESLDYEATLTGEIVSIDNPWNSQYSNITVTIKIADRPEKPIQCYRLAGEGADGLAVGDTITVTGTLKNYGGTIEFIQGCTLDAVVKGEGEVPTQPEDPKDVLDAAYALADGESLPYEAVLTGTVISIDDPFSEDYNNITVTIQIGEYADQTLVCYRMKGETAAELAEGDEITVTGTIKNYGGTIEFTNCTFVPAEEYIPNGGDMGIGALVVAMLAATAGAVIISKKKEF